MLIYCPSPASLLSKGWRAAARWLLRAIENRSDYFAAIPRSWRMAPTRASSSRMKAAPSLALQVEVVEPLSDQHLFPSGLALDHLVEHLGFRVRSFFLGMRREPAPIGHDHIFFSLRLGASMPFNLSAGRPRGPVSCRPQSAARNPDNRWRRPTRHRQAPRQRFPRYWCADEVQSVAPGPLIFSTRSRRRYGRWSRARACAPGDRGRIGFVCLHQVVDRFELGVRCAQPGFHIRPRGGRSRVTSRKNAGVLLDSESPPPRPASPPRWHCPSWW